MPELWWAASAETSENGKTGLGGNNCLLEQQDMGRVGAGNGHRRGDLVRGSLVGIRSGGQRRLDSARGTGRHRDSHRHRPGDPLQPGEPHLLIFSFHTVAVPTAPLNEEIAVAPFIALSKETLPSEKLDCRYVFQVIA